MKRTSMLGAGLLAAAALTALSGCKSQESYRSSDSSQTRPNDAQSGTYDGDAAFDHAQPRWYDDPRYDDGQVTRTTNLTKWTPYRSAGAMDR